MSFYSNNIELVPAHFLVNIELRLTDVILWSLKFAQNVTYELFSSSLKNGLGSFSGIRFILAALRMLTDAYHPVALAKIVSEGLAPLTQALFRLSGPHKVTKEIPVQIEEKVESGEENIPAAPVQQEEVTGAAVLHLFTLGRKVVRGPDWKWGDQVQLLVLCFTSIAEVY